MQSIDFLPITTDQMEVDYLEVYGSKIKAIEFKWNLETKSRITKAFRNRYPDAEVETITPEKFAEWMDDRFVEGNVKKLLTILELRFK